MSSIQSSNNIQFLSGGGEMGVLTRSKDWSLTPVGHPDTWPQSLRTTLGIILNSKFPMFLWWGEELICFYNDAYRPSLGNNGKHPSILGMPAADAWPEIWDVIKPLIDQVLSGGESTWSEDQLIPIYRNGQLEDVYWTFSYSPVYEETGKIAGVLVTCNETTEKLKAFKSIEESEERFRTMAEYSDILIGVGDENAQSVFFNKAWRDLTGRSLEELIAFGWLDVVHPDDHDELLNLYLNSFSKKIPFSTEFRARNSEGNFRWFSTKGVPRFHADGTFAGYISSSIDITEHKAFALALKESEQRFRKVANTAPVLVWMADTEKKATFFNSAWLDFTGRTAEQETGYGWTDSVHPDDLERFLDYYTAAFDKREEFYTEYRLRRNDGEYRWISDRGVPRFGLQGEFEGYIGACMDVHQKVLAEQKIRENEERLAVIIEASGLATWELNLKNSAVWYSDRYLEIMGYPKGSKLSHEDLLKRLHPDDLPIREKAFKEAFETGILHYEGRVIWEDKSIHWFEGRGKLFYDEKGAPERMIGTSRDITEDKLYEQELVKREEKFRLLADSMPQYIWTADTFGNLNYFNQSVFTYSGLSAEVMNNDGWYEIMHPDDREENKKAWERAVKSGKDFIFEHRFRRHDGMYRWQLSRAIPQKIDGVIQMWVGTSTDIQDQKMFTTELEKQVRRRTKELKELNESLAKSEERYHLMVEEVQDYAILYLNREGTVENWNKGAEKIKGYKANEIIGKNFSVFYTDADRESGLPQRLMKLAVDTGRANQEGWRVRKDGTFFWANVTITAVHNAEGEVIGFSKVTHDLTEKKETSEQLEANAMQLEQKNAELQKMNKELESFAYISSHDLQEPLRKIQTFSSRILEKDYESLSESAKDNFLRMQGAAKRMQVLIEDLLVYSRTSDTERKYVKSDLRKLIDDVKEDLIEELQSKNATIEVGEMGKADVIPFQFRQLIQNLMSNSLKFSKDNVPPIITITNEVHKGSYFNLEKLRPDVEYCHIRFTDNGIGFDSDYREKIFEVFQRLHGKSEYVGTGIGLAIVKKIVENLNGMISATSEIGHGATFDVYFPINARK